MKGRICGPFLCQKKALPERSALSLKVYLKYSTPLSKMR